MKFVDRNGKAPKDFFKTTNEAAKDWGKYYNGASILRNQEMSSSIYIINKDGRMGYSYTEASIGDNSQVKASQPLNGEKIEAIIHSHGKYEEGYKNNEFSNNDKWVYYNAKINGYVTTPNGSLQKYDVKMAKTAIISIDLPSDPNDPDRKNEIDPKDIPMEKNRVLTTLEQDKKPLLKIPEWQKDNINWTF